MALVADEDENDLDRSYNDDEFAGILDSTTSTG
jgi:hypothetical protein